jgi:hypothetical protein
LKGINKEIRGKKLAGTTFGTSFVRFTQQLTAVFSNENDSLAVLIKPKLYFMTPASLSTVLLVEGKENTTAGFDFLTPKLYDNWLDVSSNCC